MSAVTSLLGLIPGWLYAALLAASVVTNGVTMMKLSVERVAHGALKTAVAEQKAQAAQLLAAETERVRLAEQALQNTLNTQNAKDTKNAITIETLRQRLVAAAAIGLRDPHAIGPSGQSTNGAATAPPGDSVGDTAQAAGLLSTKLVGLLQSLTLDADRINAAYASCRADALAVRQQQ